MILKRFVWLLSIVLFAGAGLRAQAVPPGSADEINERTAPVGELCRAGMSCGQTSATARTGSGTGMTGEQVYNQFCFACHATGVTDAPRLANAEDWEPRLAKGMKTLVANTVNGFNIMPAMGTCMACSNDELQAAVDYMVDSAQ